MRKYFLLLAIFILFFYFSSQDARAQPIIGSYCASRPPQWFDLGKYFCSPCASACDYTKSSTNPSELVCPSGTVVVDLYVQGLEGFLSCMNLQCGDAGVPSGNTCVQQSSLDSSCVNQITHNYGWTDNYGLSAPAGKTPCECYYTYTATTPQYNKKADGTACGVDGKCAEGKCIPKLTTPACPDGTLENACCTTPGTRCKKDATGMLACQNDATCPLCTDTDGGKVPGTKGTCKDVSGGVCDWRKGGCKND